MLIELCISILQAMSVYGWNKSDIPVVQFHRKCFVVAENDLFSMANTPEKGRCEGFSCWESQLTVVNKAKITFMYNSFREEVQSKQVIRSMMKMNWHWPLEHEALKIVSLCPDTGFYKFEKNIEGLGNSFSCEYNIAIHSLSKTSQEAFLAQFSNFLEQNSMHDFNEYHEFRRSSALYFGCALTITHSNNIQSYFVCLYCTKEKSIANKYDDCVNYTRKDANLSGFPRLCSPIEFSDLYGCEPKHVCNAPFPSLRFSIFPGQIDEIYVVIVNREVWLAVNHTSVGAQDGEVDQKSTFSLHAYPSNTSLLNFRSLPKHSYAYDEENLSVLKITFPQLFSREKITRRVRQVKYSNTTEPPDPSLDLTSEYNPVCCTYLFILNFLFMISLFALVYYTYKHHVMMHPQ